MIANCAPRLPNSARADQKCYDINMIIDDEKLQRTLERAKSHSDSEVTEILKKARELKGISLEEAAVLLNLTDKKLLNDLFNTAKYVKEAIYGNRIVLFAPLYISNICTKHMCPNLVRSVIV